MDAGSTTIPLYNPGSRKLRAMEPRATATALWTGLSAQWTVTWAHSNLEVVYEAMARGDPHTLAALGLDHLIESIILTASQGSKLFPPGLSSHDSYNLLHSM